jgi:hypothetical protein
MTKKIAKKRTGLPAKEYTSENAEAYALHCGRFSFDIESALEKFAKESLPHLFKINATSTEKDTETLNTITLAYGLKTGQPLAESVEKRLRGLVVKIKRELECEYDCKKASEKALVDIVANSYVRKLSLSKKFEICQNFERFSNERNNYLSMLSKEIDRAHRQFLSSMEALKMINQPMLKVNVKTNNAFIGEHQQFNNNQNKNNEAK